MDTGFPLLHHFIDKFPLICARARFVKSTENLMWVVWVGLGLMAFTGTPAGASCPLSIRPGAPVVKFRDPLVVNCSSETGQRSTMGWEAPEGGTRPAVVTSVLLDIRSVSVWDLSPMCYLNLPGGSQCEQEVPVTVYQMPQSVSLSPSNPDTPMVEGNKYRMLCDVVNVAPSRNLSVRWRRGGEVLRTDTFDGVSAVTPQNQSSVFELTAGRDDNGSRIWCEAALTFGPSGPELPPMASKPHDVVVLYPPAFVRSEVETVEIPADLKISLTCAATGNPPPVYSWSLPPAMQTTPTSRPVLTPALPFRGTYNCTASNSQGARTKSFIVTDAPRDHTVLAATIGVAGALGVALFIAGLYFVKPDGTFGSKPSYEPASSGAV